ncbi:MAG: signal peptidase I [Balneolaceae bacterium]|nr:signal peptidase I [Balneolaceae bacterium]
MKYILHFLLVLTIIVIVGTTTFYKVDGDSMYPTLEDNELVFALDNSTPVRVLGLSKINPGDIIIYKLDNQDLLIKRCIAVPADDLNQIRKNIGGFKFDKSLKDKLMNEIQTDEKLQELSQRRIPEKKFIIMSDNLESSMDSRRLGFVDEGQIMGKLLVWE